MSLLSNVYAAGSTAPVGAQDSGISLVIMMVVFFVIMYLLAWRPQSKRAKQHQTMMDQIKVGDEVLTNGGIVGKITRIKDSFIIVELAENTQVILQKNAIATLLPKGTMKTI